MSPETSVRHCLSSVMFIFFHIQTLVHLAPHLICAPVRIRLELCCESQLSQIRPMAHKMPKSIIYCNLWPKMLVQNKHVCAQHVDIVIFAIWKSFNFLPSLTRKGRSDEEVSWDSFACLSVPNKLTLLFLPFETVSIFYLLWPLTL